jgi:serine/threonine-protein kinase
VNLKPGTEIGNYRIFAPLGEGGMGVVFVVEHRLLDRKFALKLLRPELSSDKDRVAGFLKEARAVSRVSHEHVVDVTDVGATPLGQCYYVMELLSGESLGRRLRIEGPWSVERTLHVAVQIAEALSACHAAGVIHRDLKPDNVFLVHRGGDRDFVKLLDFGVVKLADPSPSGMARTSHPTREGTVVGTPQYMSPEQCRGRREIDARSDIYSLGIVLYRMVMGRVPFDSDDWADVLIQQATAPLPPMAARRPDLPPDFERIVERAVAKDPRDRWQSAHEMRRAMLELLALVAGKGARDDADPDPGAMVQRAGPVASSIGTSPSLRLAGLHVEMVAEEPAGPDGAPGPAKSGPERSHITPATPAEVARTPLPPRLRRARRVALLATVSLGGIVLAAVATVLWPAHSISNAVRAPRPDPVPAAEAPTVPRVVPVPVRIAPRPLQPPEEEPVDPAPVGPAATSRPEATAEATPATTATTAPAAAPAAPRARERRAHPASQVSSGRRARRRTMKRDDVFDIE